MEWKIWTAAAIMFLAVYLNLFTFNATSKGNLCTFTYGCS